VKTYHNRIETSSTLISEIGHDPGPIGQAAPDAPRPVFVRAFEYPRGYEGHSHRHRLGQLVYAVRGVVSVDTTRGSWTVTSRTAVAIPPWQRHRVAAHGNASLRSVFVDPDVHPTLVSTLAAIEVDDLSHELIHEAGRHYVDLGDNAVALAVVNLLMLRLPAMTQSDISVWVPQVSHPLLQPVAAALERDPSDPRSVDAWARVVALSPRHFSRIFKEDTGVSFSTWRALNQARRALVSLASGAPVSRVAMDLGYRSTSAFIDMFKRHTGTTPGATVGRRRT